MPSCYNCALRPFLPLLPFPPSSSSFLTPYPIFPLPPPPLRYPALQWQARAARRAAGRLAQAGGWLRERAVLCRYAHVSLANLGGDSAVAVADVLMARR